MSSQAFAPLYAIGRSEDMQTSTVQLGEGVVAAARAHAFALCADDQDSSILNDLGGRVAALDPPLSILAPAILLDAQRRGAALHVASETLAHASVASIDVAVPSAPGVAAEVGPITVPSDGTLQISGPIATLLCRTPASFDTAALDGRRAVVHQRRRFASLGDRPA